MKKKKSEGRERHDKGGGEEDELVGIEREKKILILIYEKYGDALCVCHYVMM